MEEELSLPDVSISLKTFLRDEKAMTAINDIRRVMPEVQIIVADDGECDLKKEELYYDIQEEGHIVHRLLFDSGFGYKSNIIARSLQRPYLLIGSDDFLFDWSAREGIKKLVEVLDNNPDVDIASGRLNNRPYEFNLIDGGDVITEVPVDTSHLHESLYYVECDLTVNFSLMRKRVFDRVRWDGTVKIGGGEHGAFFLDCKRAGFKTVWVPGVNISEQPGRDSQRYREFRNRANSPERPCFKSRGIKRYVLGNGQVDWEDK